MPSFFAAGSPSVGTTQLTPGTPSLIAPGDLLVVPVTSKYPPNAPTVPTGYAQGAQRVGGSGSSGADTGNVYSTIFQRISSDGSEDSATVTVDIPSGNSAAGKVLQFKKNAGAAWDLEYATGVNTTPGTAWSMTFGAVSFKPGDLILVISSINTDGYTYSSELLTAAGVTFGPTESLGANGTTQGDDLGWVTTLHEVLAGDVTVQPTFTMTASGTAANNPAGAGILLRMRELGGGGAMSSKGAARAIAPRRVLKRSQRWSMVSEDRDSDLVRLP